MLCFSQPIQQWERVYNGPGDGRDIVRSMAVDSAGKVYITGSSLGRGTGDDYATVKYDSAGNQLWVRRYNGPGNSDDTPFSLAVDVLEYVYVTGYSMGKGTGYEYATIKYDRQEMRFGFEDMTVTMTLMRMMVENLLLWIL